MKIAVSYKDGEIYEHFGHAVCFAIYEFNNEDVARQDVEKKTCKMIDVTDRQGHEAMAALMRDEDVDAVICGNMGPAAKSLLLSYSIVPVTGYCGEAETAAELLVLGRLPILPGEGEGGCGGGCSGGCGGCHGHCGEGEGEDGGCCGCGH